MTTRWRQYIEKGIRDAGGPVPFALSQWGFLLPIFVTISQVVPRGGRILDVGCGAGIFTALLAHQGYEVVGIDQDPDIVDLGREMVDYFRSPASIEQASALDLSAYYEKFELVYSLGVVEHFDRDVTVNLIREQARCAKEVLVAVPTQYTRYTGPITDERLYTRGEVERIVRDAGLSVRRSFVYGEIPTRLARNLERFMPRVPYKLVKNALTFGMGTVVLGER
jgi:SAM-dependent methyltransferase